MCECKDFRCVRCLKAYVNEAEAEADKRFAFYQKLVDALHDAEMVDRVCVPKFTIHNSCISALETPEIEHFEGTSIIMHT